ncbi:uncharacterized protein LOC105157865 isoform X2 [Sesamum indicum]|uniref:Uncharacterized protein LOC105157865 isoform X2 n=1 Tax=Sesamum indicum TaxID=4182 RepID=A0A6I9STI8_SESIN|nr:uncharacterized protein LOC105157865 isoform X2 [Sesamum indicum]
MGNRRFAQALTSDDEDDAPQRRRDSNGDENVKQRKRKMVHFPDEDDEKKEMEEAELAERKKKKKKKEKEEPEPESEAASENEEQGDVEAQPMGTVVRVSGRGRGRRNHYESFEYNGHQYWLEDPALFHPENKNQKPYVAIIKDIAKTWQGELMVTGQWFYRPEEAEKRDGGNWPLCDTRELFYSFHRDEVPAESVFHKCVVHFIPLHKQIPSRQKHPGFIVQKVYDTEQRKLFKLTDKDYEENKQHEIDVLVQKTLARLGDLPDLAPEDTIVDHEAPLKRKRLLKRRSMTLLDDSREDEGLSRSQSLKPETTGNTAASSSEYYAILSNFKQLTGETQRDKWLEKLLQCIKFICTPVGSKQNNEEERFGSDVRTPSSKSGGSNNESHDKTPKDDVSFDWPDAAVPAIAALEKAAHDALSSDFQKYNQKMRQLAFNLKSNAALARRLLNRELEPAQILNMSPNELKEGLTAEEIASRKPEESGRLQMTDARCTRCMEKQVGLLDIIQTGHGDRYQLECVACGNTWYASRDDAAALTIEGPSSAKTVGTAPLATAKFEDVQKSLMSSGGGAESGSTDVLKKTTEAYIPVLDDQKTLNKTVTEENPTEGSAM